MYNEEEKDDQNPTFQSINIHRQHIITVITLMKQKLELAMCLEEVLAILETTDQNIINLQTVAHLKGIMNRHQSTKSYNSMHTKSTLMNFHSISSRNPSVLLVHETIIPTLHHRKEVRAMVKEHLQSKPELMRNFVSAIQGLCDYIEEMVDKTETEETKYRKNIITTWLRNQKYKQNLKEMENIYNIKTTNFVAVLKKKSAEKEKYVNYITELNDKSSYEWESIILKSENIMKQNSRRSEENREKLFEEAQNVTRNYQNLLQTNLNREKKLRVKRFKVESILAQLLAKYDVDIGDLQNSLEKIRDSYNDLQTDYQNLQRDFEEQTVLHTELMQEKKDEEQRIFDAKLYAIVLSRSVRIIQRWWRKIYNRWFKKKKKGKKGKKR